MLKHVVSDILDFARINAGKYTKNFKKFDYKRVIEEVVDIQRYQAEKTGLRIATKFKE
jgi:signal transduction histidine kinase